jgi:hypothetical protein
MGEVVAVGSRDQENNQRFTKLSDRVGQVEITVARIDERQERGKEDLTYLRTNFDEFRTDNTKQHGEVRALLATMTASYRTDREYKKEALERRLIKNRWLRWGGTTLIGLIIFVVGLVSRGS